MTTYKGINGTAVQNYAGNIPNPEDGQLWYDSNASEFKYQEQVTGNAWSTGNSMNTARRDLAGAGIQTSALAFGGGGPPVETLTESWNGSSWTEVADLNTARATLGGAGTQTAALAFNGGPQANVGPAKYNTESWNGSSWTTLAAPSNTNTSAEGVGSSGSQTSAIVFGGSIICWSTKC